MTTVNVTSWGTFETELQKGIFDRHDAILIQEHRLEDHKQDRAKKKADYLGWRLDLSPCEQGARGGTSGGVGALVRKKFGLRRVTLPDVSVPISGRMGFWITSGGGPGGSVLASLYLHTGCEDNAENMRELFVVGSVLRALSLPFVVGADWQMTPETLHESGWPATVGGHIARAFRPTCISVGSSREIDFFLTSSRFDQAEVTIIDEAATRPHRPASLRVRGRPAGAQVCVLGKPKVFPTERIVGPALPELCWNEVKEACEAADNEDSLNEACRQWVRSMRRTWASTSASRRTAPTLGETRQPVKGCERSRQSNPPEGRLRQSSPRHSGVGSRTGCLSGGTCAQATGGSA